MADCFPPEADDLHRRWLPREIFADIGIVDTDAVPDATADAAAVVGVEELAAQLAGILGGGSKAIQLDPPPKPTPPPAVVAAKRHGAQVCGLEGSVMAACGGTNVAGAGAAAAVTWPFVPYPPVHWQGGRNMVNLGGVLDYYYSASAFPLAPPCAVQPPANLRSGTGVFIPRTALPPAKGGIATRAWPGRPATGRKQEWQQNETLLKAAAQGEKASGAPPHACARPELALPKDWSYR